MLAERLKTLREERGLTQADLGELLHLSSTAYGYYERGERDPSTETLQALADFYNCSVDYLLGLTDVRKRSVRVGAGNSVPVPILGVIRAGTPVLASENIEGYVLVSPDEAANGDYFYLRVAGDSMANARIREGDLVYVRRQSEVDSRDIAVVMMGNEDATVKRLIRTDDGIILQPESPNAKHVPAFFPRGRGDFRIIGKVLHVKFKAE